MKHPGLPAAVFVLLAGAPLAQEAASPRKANLYKWAIIVGGGHRFASRLGRRLLPGEGYFQRLRGISRNPARRPHPLLIFGLG
jgi:hypothetical protein